MAELRTLTRWVRMPRGQAYLVALGMVLLAIVISVNAPNLADNISTDAVNDARFVPVASAFEGVVTNAGSVDGTVTALGSKRRAAWSSARRVGMVWREVRRIPISSMVSDLPGPSETQRLLGSV